MEISLYLIFEEDIENFFLHFFHHRIFSVQLLGGRGIQGFLAPSTHIRNEVLFLCLLPIPSLKFIKYCHIHAFQTELLMLLLYQKTFEGFCSSQKILILKRRFYKPDKFSIRWFPWKFSSQICPGFPLPLHQAFGSSVVTGRGDDTWNFCPAISKVFRFIVLVLIA